MMVKNHVSRYDVAVAAIRGAATTNEKVATYAHEKINYLLHLAEKDKQYAKENGKGEFCTMQSTPSLFNN